MSEKITRYEAPSLTAQEPPADFMQLAQLAIERGADVSVLERLMVLRRQVQEAAARSEYLAALAAFQDECPEIPKKRAVYYEDRPGAKAAYHYAPLEAITRIVNPLLRKHGLSYSWTTDGITDGNLLVVAVLRHVGGHEERVPFPVPVATNAKMSAAQKAGAAETYGMRRSLISILGLTTADEDNDGRDTGRKGEKPEYITEQEVADLDDRIEALSANKAKFLEVLGVPKLMDIQKKDLQRAVNLLDQKATERARRRPA